MKLNRNTIRNIGDEAYEKLKSIPHVLSISTESTQFTANKNMKQPCITVFVDKKLSENELPKEHIIPKEINGILIDVVELSSEDYQIGETSISKKPPSLQRIIAGGVQR